MQSRAEEIVKRYAGGETFKEIASDLGISRQRVHQIYHRELNGGSLTKEQKAKRNHLIVQERESGTAIKELAVRYNLTPTTVYRIIYKTMKEQKQ